jgi:hypothetical protein
MLRAYILRLRPKYPSVHPAMLADQESGSNYYHELIFSTRN